MPLLLLNARKWVIMAASQTNVASDLSQIKFTGVKMLVISQDL